MACTCWNMDYPCRTDNVAQSMVPYDVPLSVNTDVEYELDENKFPGLNSSKMERTLMIAGVNSEHCGYLPLTLDCDTQMGYTHFVNNNNSSNTSETSFVERELDTSNIVDLIDSMQECTSMEVCSSTDQTLSSICSDHLSLPSDEQEAHLWTHSSPNTCYPAQAEDYLPIQESWHASHCNPLLSNDSIHTQPSPDNSHLQEEWFVGAFDVNTKAHQMNIPQQSLPTSDYYEDNSPYLNDVTQLSLFNQINMIQDSWMCTPNGHFDFSDNTHSSLYTDNLLRCAQMTSSMVPLMRPIHV